MEDFSCQDHTGTGNAVSDYSAMHDNEPDHISIDLEGETSGESELELKHAQQSNSSDSDWLPAHEEYKIQKKKRGIPSSSEDERPEPLVVDLRSSSSSEDDIPDLVPNYQVGHSNLFHTT